MSSVSDVSVDYFTLFIHKGMKFETDTFSVQLPKTITTYCFTNDLYIFPLQILILSRPSLHRNIHLLYYPVVVLFRSLLFVIRPCQLRELIKKNYAHLNILSARCDAKRGYLPYLQYFLFRMLHF